MDEVSMTVVRKLRERQSDLLDGWLQSVMDDQVVRSDLITKGELSQQSREFLRCFFGILETGRIDDMNTAQWRETRDFLDSVAGSRARQGFTPAEMAAFVLSLRKPLLELLGEEHAECSRELIDAVMTVSVLIDRMLLVTMEFHLRSREETIRRQQQEMLELSTPVVKLWEGVLALPLIGTLDSERTQVVMESLLQKIVETSSSIAIIDITGVPMVDTLVAQHLMKTVAAARLMGAECVISGIRPQIAQTMVHLGVSFSDIVTKATLADAVNHAFRQTGCMVVRNTSP